MVVREVQVVSCDTLPSSRKPAERNADGDGGKGEVSIILEASIIIPGGVVRERRVEGGVLCYSQRATKVYLVVR